MGVYWKTDQLVDKFNNHYSKIFAHGTYVNVDKRIIWFFVRKQPEGVKVCNKKSRDTGQEFKMLSAVNCNITTAIGQDCGNKDVSENHPHI